jgi:hypothetical protein
MGLSVNIICDEKNVTAFPSMTVQLLLLVNILGPVLTNLLVNCKRSGPGIAADPFSKTKTSHK